MLHIFKRFKKIWISAVLCIVLFTSQSSVVLATNNTSSDESDASAADAIESSLYSVTTALTTYANDIVGINSADTQKDDSTTSGTMQNAGQVAALRSGDIQPGDAGAIVGYGDKERADFTEGIASNQTYAETISVYGAYASVGDNGNTYAYVRYGRLLNELGIDSTGNPAANSGVRRFGGLFIQGCHLLSSFTTAIFDFVFIVLDYLNPFRFLINDEYTGTSHTSGVKDVIDSYTQVEGSSTNTQVDGKKAEIVDPYSGEATEYDFETGTAFADSGTYGLSDSNNTDLEGNPILGGAGSGKVGRNLYDSITYITTMIYVFFRNMGMYIILPLLAAFMLCSILIRPRNQYAGTRAQTIWTFCKRAIFILVGIPLLGILYTDFLDFMINENLDISVESPSSKLVATTFVDFENWARERRLELPSNHTIISNGSGSDTGGEPDAATYRNVRSLIYDINCNLNMYGLTANDEGSLGNDYNDESADDIFYGGAFDQFSDDSGDSTGLFVGMNTLLGTYADGTYYTASSWESEVNAAYTKYHRSDLGNTASTGEASSNVTGETAKSTIYYMYDETNEPDDWLNREVADNRAIFAGVGSNTEAVWAGQSWNIFSNGSLTVTGLESDGDNNVKETSNISYSSSGAAALWYPASGSNGSAANPSNGARHGTGQDMGLSTASMYNYLSTSFNEGSLSVYSSANTTSDYTRETHYSVNIAGEGMMTFLYTLNVISCLCVFVIVGLVYCLGMLIHNVRTGISMLVQIPFALFGVLKSIAQVIVYLVAMILEILITVFIYQFVTEFTMMLATMIEGPLLNMLTSIQSTAIGGLPADVIGGSSLEQLAQEPFAFFIGFGILCAILVITLFASLKLNRGVLVAWAYLWLKIRRFITFPEMVPYFDAWAERLESMYVWDILVKKRNRENILGWVVFEFSKEGESC